MREYVLQRSEQWGKLRAELTEAQDGCCAICLEGVEGKARLDHCHRSGFIRGVLCNSCNIKLGWFEKHQSEILSYLKASGDWIEKNEKRLKVRLAADGVRVDGVSMTLTRARETSSRHHSLPECTEDRDITSPAGVVSG